MKKDIEIPIAKHVYVALIHEWNKEFLDREWNAYILNDRDTPIDMVMVVSKGFDTKRKTSTMRHAIGELAAKTIKKIEVVQEDIQYQTMSFLLLTPIINSMKNVLSSRVACIR